MSKNNKRQFKLPGSVLAKIRAPDSEQDTSKEPLTAVDFNEQGMVFEESGDRWFSSDLSKALRFYYRAHESYKQALKLDPLLNGALYNLPRLEFEVYNKFTKDESVISDDLINCADALNSCGPEGLFKDIQSLCKSFEVSINILHQAGKAEFIEWASYFNMAMCYFEYIENMGNDPSCLQNLGLKNELILTVQRCISLFDKVFCHMTNVLNNNAIDETVNLEAAAVVCTESYRMLASVYETLYNADLVAVMDSITSDFITKIDSFASTLSIDIIPPDTLTTLKIAKLMLNASRHQDFGQFLQVWSSENELNEILEKQLLEASSIRSFLEKYETNDIQIPLEIKWSVLSVMANQYRVINNKLREEITLLENSKSSENDALSSKISLLCSVFIERADIDLERSLMETPDAMQHKSILFNNCKNFLKNALIFSKKSGGLRESISGKNIRKKKQREALMRLCLIEGKSQDEWNQIIGEKYWPVEIEAIANVDAYKNFFS
ncbi:hypothetical protein JL09_g648 [Pichia kudriavzevii]|uniref:Uncharacterized protein n=1 Tax=Pichia kudriavzevii TaxID=4909 RepID=A0A099P861_PICKU|nr:hypothetical protein JL09_g648 [Pichia kudriavzevii]